MKASDFRKFYLSFVTLYGAIFSDDAYLIMKKFFPDLKKKELNADLRSRRDKLTRRYTVYSADRGKFVICDEFYDFDDLNALFKQQMDKPFYVCEDLEKYWSYGAGYEDPIEGREEMQDYIEMRINRKDRKILAAAYCRQVCDIIRNTNPLQQVPRIADCLGQLKIVKNKEDIMELIPIWMNLQKNIRLKENRGYTPAELHSIRKPVPEKISMEIGENMKRLLLSGEIDGQAFLEKIRNNRDLPIMAKESMIAQIEEILAKKKHLS